MPVYSAENDMCTACEREQIDARRPPPAARGFTLLELIIVMAVVALLLATAVPRIGAGWKRLEERQFLQDFVHAVAQARLSAMQLGEVTSFHIRGGSQRVYGIGSVPDQPIPPDAELYSDELDTDPKTGDSILTFYPDGSPSGGEIEIVFDKVRTYRVSIHPLTGSVRWAQVEGKGKRR